ncbi:hypothetical protein [Rubinisphaera sp.]|nr:hypothetical protein [Rubinisphaera sp.]
MEERQFLSEQKNELKEELQNRISKIEGWVSSGFTDVREEPRVPYTERNGLNRWKHVRARFGQKYLDYPAFKSRGDISSGRALNYFIDELGNSALRQHFALRSPVFENAEDGSSQKEIWLLLKQIEEETIIPAVHLEQLYCERGGTGPKLPVKLTVLAQQMNVTVLPLEWPAFFRVNSFYLPYMQSIETYRERALKEMTDDSQLDVSHRYLMAAIDTIQERFEVDKRAIFQRKRENASLNYNRAQHEQAKMDFGQDNYNQLIEANRFLTTLKYGTARMMESQITKITPLQGRPIDNKISVIELLAFMKENGLRFTRATPSVEHHYEAIFEQCKNYHESLLATKVIIENRHADIDELEQKIDELSGKQATLEIGIGGLSGL